MNKENKIGIISVRVVPKEELDTKYGTRTCPVGDAYKRNGHYYLQREADVLHLNCTDGFLLNNLHVGYINSITGQAVKITYAEFVTAVKEMIYNNDIHKFWGA
jgi:hypothetical protein